MKVTYAQYSLLNTPYCQTMPAMYAIDGVKQVLVDNLVCLVWWQGY
ncbi:MAG: hypothetical protein HC856_08965 [Pseudanabaena sp. RU_4_16]|nr:hypothetical protein [Pseudanabaena sp. SU_2_4]NJM28299.1 hypothetical protein [Pseudanabaena sp. RU_4_16]NKB17312.1 hypothetical protein [Pseudanabaena sp. CRU_2_10]